MLLEETSGHPLVNSVPYVFYEFTHSPFIFLLGLLDGFEEKFNEAFQRVLVHMVDDAE